MRLVRAIWKLLVGVKDALVLLLLVLFFGGLYAALSSKPPAVREGVLTMALNGSLVEQAAKPSTTEVLSGQSGRMHQFALRDLIAVLDAARTDDRVKGIALDLDGFLGGGQAAIGELGQALTRVKASGKPVLAYATGYTDDGYQLASHASEIWLAPLGTVAIAGPGTQHLYYKGLLDKLGVTANVYRVGTYKSAVEPYIRNDMSPEAKAAAQSLGDTLLQNWRDEVTRARPAAKIDAYMKDQPAAVAAAGGDLAIAARNAGLVDQIADRRAFEQRLAKLGGADGKSKLGYRSIRLDSFAAAAVDRNPRGPIGVVTIAGEIVDGKAPLGTAGGDSIAAAIRKGIADDKIKALVVRIDSPGGSVLASERIRQALLEAKEQKLPIVVSMGSVAASGGYWVSTPADYVFAEPSTITGSIGVFGILPSFRERSRNWGSARTASGPRHCRASPTCSTVPPRPPGSSSRPASIRSIAASSALSARRGTRLPRTSTRSRRAGCGTAAPLTSWGWSTASAAWTPRSPRQRRWQSSATSAASVISTARRAFAKASWRRCSTATRTAGQPMHWRPSRPPRPVNSSVR